MKLKHLEIFNGYKLFTAHAFMLFALFLLSGCAAPTSDDVRKNPAESATFHVNLKPKAVYRNMVSGVGQCFVYGSRYASLVQKEVVPKENYLLEVHMAGLGLGTELVIDIKQNADGTDVTYYRNSGYGGISNLFKNFHETMVQSANDPENAC